jgi:putative ABC transport system permease protein
MRILRNLRVSWFLAVRSVARGNAGVTIMTILMMAVVLNSVLFLPSLINGAITTLNRQIVDTATSDLIITSSTVGGGITDAAAYVDRIRASEGVDAATATLRIGTQIAHGSRSNAWGVDAIDPDSYAAVFTTPQHLIEGSYLDPADTDGILLGVDIAGADRTTLRMYSNSLQTVHAGDVVEVTLLGGKTASFTVRGIYQNFFSLSDQGAYVTRAAAEALLPQLKDAASRVFVRTAAGVGSADLETRIGALRSGVSFQTPEQLSAAIQDQIDTFDLINNIMRVISLLVAAITVFIITYVDLTNRRRQIGIERAIGIRSGAIVGGYVIKSMITASAGVVLGLLLFQFGVIPLVDRYPFIFPNGPVRLVESPQIMIGNLVILLVVAVVSSIIPSIRTVSMKILDAIWGT